MLIYFIDDTSLITSADSHDDHISSTNRCLSSINNWMSKLHLSLNPNKTKALCFIFYLYQSSLSWSSPAFLRSQSPHLKYYGITMDDELSFLSHNNHTSEEAKILYNIIRQIFENLWSSEFFSLFTSTLPPM